MTIVSKSISIPNEEFSDDTTLSVARKFLNEEAAKFVRDIKSLANKADETLAKHKALEFEIECLLRVVVSQDILLIVQCNTVLDTSNLQTELDRMKEKLETCIIEMEKEYTVLWNNWYKNVRNANMTRFYTLDPLSQKSEDENVIPKVGKSNDLSKPITSNLAPSSRESTVVNNERVIAPGIFRINPFKASRVDNFVPNKHVKESAKTKPITVSQPHVITKKDVNSNTNGFSSKDVKSTTRTRRPQLRNNPNNDKVFETPEAEFMYLSACCLLSSSRNGLCTL
ncbi:hypothetical protein Tco_0264774 [Tanacetum coccineum]